MPVTKEIVEAKAKELGLTITPEEVALFVKMGVLPAKAEPDSSSRGGGDDGNGDGDGDGDDNLTDVMRKRLNKEKEKRVAMQRDFEAKSKRLEELENIMKDKTRSDSEKKGEYDKLLKETTDLKEALNKNIAFVQNNFREKTIESEARSALLSAGVPSDRLPKALKLFLLEKGADVNFEFTNKDKFEYDIDGVSEAVEAFKKENDFLFVEGGDTNQDPNKFNPVRKPPKGTPPDASEKAKEALRKRFPRIFPGA